VETSSHADRMGPGIGRTTSVDKFEEYILTEPFFAIRDFPIGANP
jgi:hypothetical protein